MNLDKLIFHDFDAFISFDPDKKHLSGYPNFHLRI
jgi:hypothetical protein